MSAADADVADAVAALRRGEAIGLPTETVYGLAADASRPDAVARIFALKGRPADHPLIVHVADAAALAEVEHVLAIPVRSTMEAAVHSEALKLKKKLH